MSRLGSLLFMTTGAPSLITTTCIASRVRTWTRRIAPQPAVGALMHSCTTSSGDPPSSGGSDPPATAATRPRRPRRVSSGTWPHYMVSVSLCRVGHPDDALSPRFRRRRRRIPPRIFAPHIRLRAASRPRSRLRRTASRRLRVARPGPAETQPGGAGATVSPRLGEAKLFSTELQASAGRKSRLAKLDAPVRLGPGQN